MALASGTLSSKDRQTRQPPHRIAGVSGKLELHPELPSGSNGWTLQFVVHPIRPRCPWRDVADLGEGHVRQIQSGIAYSARSLSENYSLINQSVRCFWKI